MMTTVKNILFWCLFGIFLVAGFLEAAEIRRFSSITLRYENPINGTAARRARQYAVQNGGDDVFWPTFWHESRAVFSTSRAIVSVDTIVFSGDAALVWPVQYIVGSAPGSLDNNGVSISESLAHELFGSVDIVGMVVEIDGAYRMIRGIFAGDTDLALISFCIEDISQSWTGVALFGGPAHPTRQDAQNFASFSGLGRPDYVLTAGFVPLAWLMAIFPLLILGGYAGWLVGKQIKQQYPGWGGLLFLAGFLLLAVGLPYLLNLWPDWIIPTHWSDFNFWSTLFHQTRDGLQEFLSVNPGLRDVALRVHLLRQVGILFVSVCCGLILCFRWSLQRQ